MLTVFSVLIKTSIVVKLIPDVWLLVRNTCHFFRCCIWILGNLISNFTHSELNTCQSWGKTLDTIRCWNHVKEWARVWRQTSLVWLQQHWWKAARSQCNDAAVPRNILQINCSGSILNCCSWLVSLAHVQSISDTVGIKKNNNNRKKEKKQNKEPLCSSEMSLSTSRPPLTMGLGAGQKKHIKVVSQSSLSGLHTGLSAWHTHTMKHLRGLWRLSTIDRWDSKPQFSAAPV